jgi:hypothetical protein
VHDPGHRQRQNVLTQVTLGQGFDVLPASKWEVGNHCVLCTKAKPDQGFCGQNTIYTDQKGSIKTILELINPCVLLDEICFLCKATTTYGRAG